jgi:predicted DNA-binding transcriptional regulator YafY
VPRHRSNEAQVVRCIALLIAMVRAKRGINIRQFADRKGWHWRAAYRDVETLRAAGIPIEHEHGWFRVTEAWIPASAVDVKPDELYALRVVRQVISGLRDTVVGRSLDSLCAKLSSTSRQVSLPLPEDSWLVARSAGAIDYRDHGPALVTLREAIEQRHAVQLAYRKPNGEETTRVVEPAFLFWDAQLETMYVRAWCRLREAFRTFAVHRVVSATALCETFLPRPEAARALADAFRIWCGPSVVRVVLKFSPSVAAEIRERRVHSSQMLTEQSDGAVVVELHVSAPLELERWLLGFGPDVEVIEPAELSLRVQERHQQAVGGLPDMAPARRRPAGAARAGMLRAHVRDTVATRPTRRRRSVD